MLGLLALLAVLPAGLSAQQGDVVFVPTPMEVVIGMLNLAGVSDRDVVYDLGSGDGRIVIAAARHYGARAVGIDIDSGLVQESRRSADTAGVARKVEFRRGDLFETDVREATVVTLYLTRALNERLRPNLFRELRPGSRVVSQNFDMGDWEPDSLVTVRGKHFGETPVHLWVIPANVAGDWTVELDGPGSAPTRFGLSLTQRYQIVTAGSTARGRLRGYRLVLIVRRDGRSLTLEGTVDGDTIHGSLGHWNATRPPRPEARRP
jgi:SAM-dependent methyltransferase